jgi:[protein-PII] uridylyltransferase
MKDWPPERLEPYIAKLYPAYWLKVDLPHKIEHANFVRASRGCRQAARDLNCVRYGTRSHRTYAAGTRPSMAALHHRRGLRHDRANIVDAQIYTTTDGRALDTISLSREIRPR